MSVIPELLDCAVAHHKAGRFAEAEGLYRRVLTIEPRHADSHHLLGLLAGEAGNYPLAVACIGRAIQFKPWEPLYYRNLGLALHRDQRYEQAIICYSKAIELEPNHAETLLRMGRSLAARGLLDDAIQLFLHARRLAPNEPNAHLDLGLAFARTGKLDEAAASFGEALWLRPNDPQAAFELGNSLHMLDRLVEAEQAYRRVVALEPRHPDAWFNLGVTLSRRSSFLEAIAAYEAALEIRPSHAAAHNNLANLRQAQGKLDEAIAGYQAALRLEPANLDTRYNLGLAFQERFRFDEALDAYDDVLSHQPDHVEAQNNRANTLLALGRPREAVEGYTLAIRRQPDHLEANFNRGIARLLLGNFAEGWQGYEWRSRQTNAPRRDFEQPLWDGEPLTTQTLLVHAEQGLGDAIQFVRYLPLVRERCARVFFECQPRLVPLFAGLSSIDGLIARGSPLPDFDFHIPLMSLPRVFETTLETIPSDTPYLAINPDLVGYWRRRIGFPGRRKIGLVWGGNAGFKNELRRGLPLETFRPLAALRDVALFSLQRGPQARQLEALPPGMKVHHLEPEENQITDTAAILHVLDRVITVDTMVAHLAGALARPVWTLLSFAPDWRWLLDRPDSPWYPTMRLFRQPREGDWETVVHRVAAELKTGC
ncbi:MAG: tetratricopeptide repeat protein [Bryobacteraceae bacterium]|nr:tetratricopeptide repeat protein [Bryobacteraceae bacterium]